MAVAAPSCMSNLPTKLRTTASPTVAPDPFDDRAEALGLALALAVARPEAYVERSTS